MARMQAFNAIEKIFRPAGIVLYAVLQGNSQISRLERRNNRIIWTSQIVPSLTQVFGGICASLLRPFQITIPSGDTIILDHLHTSTVIKL